jgi:hypothetical protein
MSNQNYFHVSNNWRKCLKEMPIFTQTDIAEYQREKGNMDSQIQKPSVRGNLYVKERYIDADSIETVCESDMFLIRGKCHASKKQHQHEISVGLDKATGKVIHAYCTCKAGSGGLDSHTTALMKEIAMYSLQELDRVPAELAVTSKLCTWSARSSSKVLQKEPYIETVIKKLSKVNIDEIAGKCENRSKGISCTLYEARHNKHVDVEVLKEYQKNLAHSIPAKHILIPPSESTAYNTSQ